MIVHGTATAIGNYLKKMDSSLKDDEVILMTYFFIKKDYDLIFEDAEVDSNLEKNLLMKSSEQTVQTATGRYKYSVSIEDLYIGVFKALAKAIIGTILLSEVYTNLMKMAMVDITSPSLYEKD